jgi:CRP-like cAMP-binding protein
MTHSPVALAAIKLLCGRVRECSEHFEAIALHPVEVRLARLLLDRLAERTGSESRKAKSLTLEMTQSELALLIGTTRQRANAALAVLDKAGGIRRVGDRVHCDPVKLKRLALRD